ncbi:putative Sporulation domain protein [Sterolibacterium denitrificans]|uniref:Sporulation domain protein n=1 Tax=Sterolibacterium denitrificans TaxID=157592 RepID=A0A7Z7HPG8_9PROT|nr:SPOR domain-containing protein [Sterolibacterium denitrificans]SMB22725.1 putative Sporulation domain protein [Sterolibacterium denitrificans]
MTLFWRIVLLLAIFGNLLFFAWSQGYFGRLEDGREPLRIKHQLAPEKLRILAAAPESSAASTAPASAAAAPADEAICRLVGDNALPAADAQRLYERVQGEATVATGLQAVVKPIELPPRYWVHFPPLPSRELVDRKLQELRNLGITDAMPMLGDGDDHFAISLGMFSTPEAAETHLAAMQRRGVRTAVIEKRARTAAGTTGKAQVEVRGPQALVLQRLPELLNELGLARTHVADCPETSGPTKDPTPPASP